MSVTHRTLFRCLTYYEVMAHQVVRLHHRASQVFRHKKNGVTTLRWFGLFEEKTFNASYRRNPAACFPVASCIRSCKSASQRPGPPLTDLGHSIRRQRVTPFDDRCISDYQTIADRTHIRDMLLPSKVGYSALSPARNVIFLPLSLAARTHKLSN